MKGLHRRTQQAIMRERGRLPFAGIRDFWQRCRPTSSECLALHDAGAFLTLLSTYAPAERDWLVITATREPRTELDDDDQLRFDFAPAPSADPRPPANLSPVTQGDCDRRAWNMLGCLPRIHPFALWDLPQRRLFCRDIGPQCAKRTVILLVWVITRKQVEAVHERARDGTPLPEPSVSAMAFVTLEDNTGTLESVWFPEVYRACGPLIESGRPFWVQGKGSLDHGVISLEVVKAWLP